MRSTHLLSPLPLTLAVLVACAPPAADSAPESTGTIVAAPLGAAFRAEGAAFASTSDSWTFGANLDEQGAQLAGPAGRVRVSFAGWGRGEIEPAGEAAPSQVCGTVDETGQTACRVEYARASATEWWVNAPAGLEQGWDLLQRPSGSGDIVLALEVEGANAVSRGDSVELVTSSGVWMIEGLHASDAEGRPLAAFFEVDSPGSGGRIRIVVDDTDAVWPIRVDPVMTTAVTTWTGATSSTDALGTAVTTGDFNKDGKADIAIGVPGYNGAAGAVYVYVGTSTAPSTTPSVTLTVPSGAGKFGYSLDSGDVNGDTYLDLIVGAPYSTTTTTNDGAVWVYHGSSSGLSSTMSTKLTGSATASAYFGNAVACGDVNGDGYSDVVIGEYGYSSSTGRAWIYAGSSSGVSTTVRTLTGLTSGDQYGWSVSAGKSATTDVYSEMAVGAPARSTNKGRVSLYTGASTFFTTTPTKVDYDGGNNNYRYGYSVSVEGSYNGDAYADMVVGAVTATSAANPKGRVYYYQSTGGASGAIPTGNTANFDGPSANGYFGGALAAIGDTDDDGYSELLVGAPTVTTDAGYTALYDGSSSGLASTTVSTTFTGSSGNKLGTAVGGGDVNGDGNADILLASPGYGSGAGRVVLELGGVDADGDGYVSNGSGYLEDCADSNSAINPAATEICDAANTDEDCDGLADNLDSSAAASGRSTWYLDADGDGYGAAATSVAACDQPSGYVANATDCDDSSAAANPGAVEICDAANADEDCDGLADDLDGSASASGKTTYYVDSDGDSYGGSSSGAYCDMPAGSVATATDCDDADAAIHPGATELCDASNTDEDCDGLADDLDGSVSSTGKTTWYEDADGDTYGGSSSGSFCDQPSGSVATSTDCDDSDAAIHPGATEVCDASNTDEDCDGLADDLDASAAASGKSTYYADADADTYGSSTSGAYCDRPSGYVTTATDCDDTDGAVHPGATEICDAANTDEDCDGAADDDDASAAASGKTTYYVDADADTYGSDTSGAYCDAPSGYVATSTDCDDADAAVHPGATEICDAGNTDEDCDGLADDLDASASASGKTTWYADADADTYGGDTSGAYCDRPSGYVAASTDCDDTDAAIHPGATEVCDSGNTDEDCDGVADDLDASVSASGTSTWYADVDADSYGSSTAVTVCDAPSGYVATSTDCDDTDAAVHPGATEVCDAGNTDEDCDGAADDADASVAASGKSTYYADADADTYGSSTSGAYCDRPTGYVANSTDCDDADAAIHPGATEICDAGNTDEDCDGAADDADASAAASGKTSYYADEDGDSYGSGMAALYCDQPAGSVATATDCDDTDAAVNPGATEICDAGNTDEDCDGLADDLDTSVSAAGKTSYYADSDADTYGSSTSGAYCDRPAGYVVGSTDCDDSDPAVNPGATEVCDAGNTDEDCNGLADDLDSGAAAAGKSTYYVDADADTYGSAGGGAYCDAPSGYVATSTDCDDSDAAVNPGATEICDAGNTDEDCDGLADDLDASTAAAGKSTWYADSDADTYGGSTSAAYCDLPSGYVATSTDCDDADAAIYPGATEVCDGADNDCDGLADDGVTSTFYADSDSDGFGDLSTSTAACSAPAGFVADATDCDDGDADVSPGATERCDAADTDEDCDGRADDDDTAPVGVVTYYVDMDGDTYGAGAASEACDPPADTVADTSDCDDADGAVHPGALDIVGDAIDNDCDGSETCYADADEDGYRPDSGATVASVDDDCADAGEALRTEPAGDCDDADSAVNPAATDVAGDGVDADCDGGESCYVDADGDSARTAFVVTSADADCMDVGEALGSADLDCDDSDADAYPGAAEVVGSGVDEDCDGEEVCYLDADDDGYRPDSTSTVASVDSDCADAGEALDSDLTGDCDDGDDAFHPGADESDCTDPADYNCDGSTGYADADADGWGACEECDDTDATVNPDGVEAVGDGVDSDCDGLEVCYEDADGDAWRTDTTVSGGSVACNEVGEASAAIPDGDCDDADASINPDAIEVVGDEIDADCDDAELCYVDADADLWRTEASVTSSDLSCIDAGEATADQGLDCDDTDATINPAGAETAGDGIDADCDGGDLCFADVDGDGYRSTTTVVSSGLSCTGPGEATAAVALDCDDGDAGAYPGALEIVGDAVDSDCDGSEVCYADLDDDAYRPDDGSTVASADSDCDDAGEALLSALAGDCDDADTAYNPGAAEGDCADPNDYNCDGSTGFEDVDGDGWAACLECNDADSGVNPDAVEVAGDLVDGNCDGAEDCYVDADDDSWRPDDSTFASGNVACDASGEATAADPGVDCDDADATINPAATEVTGDEVDSDCDGAEVCFVDGDGDGYRADGGAEIASADLVCSDAGEAGALAAEGDCDDASATRFPGAPETDCADPVDYNCDGSSGYADADADGYAACEECADGDAAVNPDAEEVCNGVDDDCDGVIDGPTASGTSTWYADSDGDGYTDSAVSTIDCSPPAGYAAESAVPDCDDGDATVNPAGTDIPDDGVDQDCDGADAVGDTGGDTGEDTGGDTGGDTGEDTGPVDSGDTDNGTPPGGGDDTGETKGDACGCASTSTPAGGAALLLGLAALARGRRRR
ncbi:hypothetical protein LBMAG42_39260 [Deltaproteobacteria bacterium]|nr:hypothetical protein LBMAG42_39260 [Deltaproteobacteria bacterium]